MNIRLRIWKNLVSREMDLCRGREGQVELEGSLLDQVGNQYEHQTENMERFGK